jgi:hypothetical protein
VSSQLPSFTPKKPSSHLPVTLSSLLVFATEMPLHLMKEILRYGSQARKDPVLDPLSLRPINRQNVLVSTVCQPAKAH